jgi:hypothetical protein
VGIERAPAESASIVAGQDARPGRGTRLLGYFRAHPILLLAVLTPGIPEYVLGSSSIANLVLNPAWFFLQLAINVGQYTAGALLIREALVRWGKGPATFLLLGAAYGLTEEGLGDNTILNPLGATAPLGSFGHFAGVNWIWATGVLAYHIIFSLGVPLVLFGLILPETRGRVLLTTRGIAVCFGTLSLTTAVETLIVNHQFGFWMGLPLLAGVSTAIVLLVLAARVAPRDLWVARGPRPSLGDRGVWVLGLAVFPISTVLSYGLPAVPHLPPFLVVGAMLLEFALVLEVLRRTAGREANSRFRVEFAYGLVLSIALFGALVQLTALDPVQILLVVLVVLFFRRLERRYAAERGTESPVSVPAPPSPS